VSDQDLIASSFAGTTNPQDTQLSDRDKALLIKLLSNPAFFPEAYKAWLGAIMPFIIGDLPISQVSGFLPLEKLKDFPNDNMLFPRGDGTWVHLAGSLVRTFDDASVDWDSSLYSWDG
jgi:hypothetical protein